MNPTIARLEKGMNREERRCATAFLSADLGHLFRDGASRKDRTLRCKLVDRAERILSDDRTLRADDLTVVRRACEMAQAAGFGEVAVEGARRALVAAGFMATPGR